jgi:mannose-1-phosphate guanylyltransferase/phosphomannomutase
LRAFIIGGGKGSRTANPSLPKVLTPLSDSTILEYQIEELQKSGKIDHITLLLGFGHEQVVAFLNSYLSKANIGLLIDYIIEEEPLGSGGMLKRVLSECEEQGAFVVLGDILPRGGILESISLIQDDSENYVFVHPNNHPFDSDSIISTGGYASKIIKKNDKEEGFYPNLSPVGFFFFRIADLDAWPIMPAFDLVHDALSNLIAVDKKVRVQEILKRSTDLGTPQRLELMQTIVTNYGLVIDGAIFIDRDETIIRDPRKDKEFELVDEISLIEGVAEFLKAVNTIGIPVVCVSNQPAIAKGFISWEKVEMEFQLLRSKLDVSNVYVDKYIYCPHYPESGFEGEIHELKVICDCRKPKPGMIVEISRIHSLDLTRSVIIGDSWMDIEIDVELGSRIHYFPYSEKCDILHEHHCASSFEEILILVKKFFQEKSSGC